ncbi:glutaredoxin domain-containing protein [Amycolatopsis alkalitolerans]|uniref:Glutaredoxin n=1 Tax=Amycolatopsis alkalitolerans TaxID=2547244 RepID=A0A5C4M7L4_9PSEU|nr:glutaredoxin domain-containing protein [Amycolatopsis alkalitolerans]TNC28041.1 glutaredoxin [Amycolatopsis alkalitolerans]
MSGDVTVYWRPGCPYCARLFGDLDRLGLPIRKVNIWEEPGAAARVRAVAGGNETVPTVVVGEAAMVNPRAIDVVEAVRRDAPRLLGDVDPARLNRAAVGPWWSGLPVTVAATVAWIMLAASNPTTTYHFAPLVVAAAWPAGRRLRAARALPRAAALAATVGGVLMAVAATVVLRARGALAGPALFGLSTVSEALASAVVGGLIGAALALIGRRP